MAAIIDAVLIFLYIIAVTVFLYRFRFDGILNTWTITAIYLLPTIFYYPLCEYFFNGRSLGKQLLGLRVTTRDGSRPGIGAFLIRWLLLFVDAGSGFVVGILCIIFSKNSQRLGDLAAGTMVVSDRIVNNNRVNLAEYEFLTRPYTPRFATASLLTPGQAEGIRLTLSLGGADRLSRLYDLSRKVEAIVGPMPPGMDVETYLVTVWRDYQYQMM